MAARRSFIAVALGGEMMMDERQKGGEKLMMQQAPWLYVFPGFSFPTPIVSAMRYLGCMGMGK